MRFLRSPLPLFGMMMMVNMRPSLGLDDVVMKVTYEGSPNFLINVTFTWSMFTTFYMCMCNRQTYSCIANYLTDNLEANTISSTQSQDQGRQICGLFRCTNSRQYTNVTCVRTDFQQSSCHSLVNPGYFTLPEVTSCGVPCVGIDWTLTQEQLSFNNNQPSSCKSQCCSTTSTSVPNLTSLTSVTALPSNSQSTAAYNTSELWPDSTESGELLYLETIIISGVTGGLVFVAFVFVIIILLVMRKPDPASTRESNNPASWSSPGSVTNGQQTGKNKTPNQRDRYLQNTISNQGHSKWPPDIRIVGVQNGQGGLGHGKNALNGINNSTGSVGNSSEHFDEVCLHGTGEGSEYALIDEAQVIQGARPYDSASGCTDNDGYSSLDELDYYNIEGDGSSPSKAVENSGDQKGGKQLQSDYQEIQPRRHRHALPAANQISEYSLAKSSIGDGDNESEVGLDRATGLSGDVSCGDKDMGRLPARPTLELQLGAGGSMEIADGSKRNDYFELTKEEEEGESLERIGGSKTSPYFKLSKEEEEENNMERDDESKRNSVL